MDINVHGYNSKYLISHINTLVLYKPILLSHGKTSFLCIKATSHFTSSRRGEKIAKLSLKPLLQKDLQHCTMYANIHLGIICTKINDYK